MGFSLFLDLTNMCFLFTPAQMVAEQKDLGDCAMGDCVHATVSVKQPTTVQDQSSQTTYHPNNGEKACPCCHFYGIPCRQVRVTEDEATTRRNQRLLSNTKRKDSHLSMSYRPSRRERIMSALEIHRSRTKHSMIMLMG